MELLYLIVICLILQVYGFELSSTLSKRLKSSLSMELQLKYVKIPIQTDSKKYEILLKTKIPENQIIRYLYHQYYFYLFLTI